MTKDLPELEEDEDDDELDGWLGFTIIDDHWGIIGVIEELKILPGQELAVVTYKEKKISIPLVEDLIYDLDLETQTIRMNLPDGLLDL